MPSQSVTQPGQGDGPPSDAPGQAAVRPCGNPQLQVLVRERTAALLRGQRLMRMALDHMDQGLVLLDQSQTVRLCNPRALELLHLPELVLHEGAAFSDIRAFQNRRGDFALVPPATLVIISGGDARRFPLIYDWPRPDGITLEVRRVQLEDGSSVNTFTDVTVHRAAELAARRLAERVEELAQIDELTGALNRRYILRTLNGELARAAHSAEPCSIAMIDLDLFKQINDRFGHPVGDQVLRGFAIAVSANLRTIDRLGRYGGEEFLLVLPQASQARAAEAVNRLREIVAGLDWSAISDGLAATLSAGVTEIRSGETSDELLARADAAMYRAKRAGRNRVVSA
jgi:diguanylate cyclase (GGDEF)-like protein